MVILDGFTVMLDSDVYRIYYKGRLIDTLILGKTVDPLIDFNTTFRNWVNRCMAIAEEAERNGELERFPNGTVEI